MIELGGSTAKLPQLFVAPFGSKGAPTVQVSVGPEGIGLFVLRKSENQC